VTAPSVYAAGRLEEYGLGGVVPVSNGVDLDRFHPARKDAGMFAKWGVPAGARVILHHGRLYRSKRVDLILRAFSGMPENVWLVVSGDGPDRNRLENIAPDRTRFVGHVDDEALPALYACADLFAIASSLELQGIVVLEAMASGLGVVSVAAGALPELVVDGANGFLCPEDSVEGFRTNMLMALERSLELGTNARSMALAHGLSSTVERFEALLAKPQVGTSCQ
jgi:glycosyltransferase involved in cell wall biosynthesis